MLNYANDNDLPESSTRFTMKKLDWLTTQQ